MGEQNERWRLSGGFHTSAGLLGNAVAEVAARQRGCRLAEAFKLGQEAIPGTFT